MQIYHVNLHTKLQKAGHCCGAGGVNLESDLEHWERWHC